MAVHLSSSTAALAPHPSSASSSPFPRNPSSLPRTPASLPHNSALLPLLPARPPHSSDRSSALRRCRSFSFPAPAYALPSRAASRCCASRGSADGGPGGDKAEIQRGEGEQRGEERRSPGGEDRLAEKAAERTAGGEDRLAEKAAERTAGGEDRLAEKAAERTAGGEDRLAEKAAERTAGGEDRLAEKAAERTAGGEDRLAEKAAERTAGGEDRLAEKAAERTAGGEDRLAEKAAERTAGGAAAERAAVEETAAFSGSQNRVVPEAGVTIESALLWEGCLLKIPEAEACVKGTSGADPSNGLAWPGKSVLQLVCSAVLSGCLVLSPLSCLPNHYTSAAAAAATAAATAAAGSYSMRHGADSTMESGSTEGNTRSMASSSHGRYIYAFNDQEINVPSITIAPSVTTASSLLLSPLSVSEPAAPPVLESPARPAAPLSLEQLLAEQLAQR
ncbi:hypothetical protein CLOM_g54 [Closterium sp. NIES-68]|nr:hypothetical protein CLOM_g54 [Closterium sp. NIES-68]